MTITNRSMNNPYPAPQWRVRSWIDGMEYKLKVWITGRLCAYSVTSVTAALPVYEHKSVAFESICLTIGIGIRDMLYCAQSEPREQGSPIRPSEM